MEGIRNERFFAAMRRLIVFLLLVLAVNARAAVQLGIDVLKEQDFAPFAGRTEG